MSSTSVTIMSSLCFRCFVRFGGGGNQGENWSLDNDIYMHTVHTW